MTDAYSLDTVHAEIYEYYQDMHRSVLDLYERQGRSKWDALQVRTQEVGRLGSLWALADLLHEEEPST